MLATVNTYRQSTWGTLLWELKQQHGLSFVVITDHFFDKLTENLDGKNNLDMFVKSDQEITDEQAVYRPWHLGWEDLHTRRKHRKMVFMYRIVNHLTEIPACTILQSVGASQTRGHNHRYLVPYWSVDAYKFAFFPGIRLWNSLPTETVSVQSLGSFKILVMDWCP